jgi:hypothetical protein
MKNYFRVAPRENEIWEALPYRVKSANIGGSS